MKHFKIDYRLGSNTTTISLIIIPSTNHYTNELIERIKFNLNFPEKCEFYVKEAKDVEKVSNSPFGVVEALRFYGYTYPTFSEYDHYKFLIQEDKHIDELEKIIWAQCFDFGIRF
ncbi:hypothetical protein CkP1_0023 [Citrobacter phage CkP1]|nr:hypothetical protein CkP1_0023 [Citrobacter phage CkP1]